MFSLQVCLCALLPSPWGVLGLTLHSYGGLRHPQTPAIPFLAPSSPVSTHSGLRYPQTPAIPFLAPASPVSTLLYSQYSTPFRSQHSTFQAYGQLDARVICKSCSCDDDFFCAYNCPVCSSEETCSACTCTTSLACAKNCQKCFPQSDPPAEPSCVASGGPAVGETCIFPFTYQGVEYDGCAPLPTGGTVNLYSSGTWCSTRVDVNNFHIRGPFDNLGKHVGFCDNTCPVATKKVFF